MDALVVAALVLVGVLAAAFAVRRRSARRAAEERERARRRRRPVPAVSANVRGLPHDEARDLWVREMSSRKDRVA